MSSVFQNFRSRKIVQWGLAYLAGAWLLLQVATTTGGNFGWPPSVLRALTIILAAGFPITLVLAWYHGEKGRQRASGPELLMVAALLILAGAALALVRGGDDRGPPSEEAVDVPTSPATDRSSIAVLPFTNLSGDPEQDYFSDGMTEEIISRLSTVEGLKVISRTSVMRYKGSDRSMREIAGELGVGTVLEGSVRREGDRVRVTAQLIDATSDAHLWSETYDRDLESVFAIQSDVATSIVRALELELTTLERRRVERVPTSSQEAYQLYLRARYFWNRRTFEDLHRALELFEKAIRADSAFALAHVGTAETYLILPFYGEYSTDEAFRRSGEAAARALELDPTSGEAYATLAALAHNEWQWDRADQLYQRAIELSPGYATAHQWYAEYLMSTGRTKEAVAEAESARELDPQSMIITTIVAEAYYYDRRFDDAIATARAATEMTHEVAIPYGVLIVSLQHVGRYEEAIETLSTFAGIAGGPEAREEMRARLADAWRERGERGYWETSLEFMAQLKGPEVPVATALLHLGDRERAFETLERGVEARTMGYSAPDILYDPGLDPIRDDRRFLRLAERMGLPPRARSQ